jgi:hypothetical protein
MRQADIEGQTRTAGAAPGARAVADPGVPVLVPPPAPTGTAGDGGWEPPDDKKATMLVHPLVRSEVRALLNRDPSLHGLGYTEFLHAAVEAYRAGRWHPRALVTDD